ncbi:stalk domain-containing protein [Paenibacillus vini]|uniref:stalk domain-containing protein n=1 Tax=Paenibacillus vini TaxID=1476024 RepID=UPI0025B67228|nr:stalk domain-containing protein [Paenibacillus vini]MDN4069268.1 stalk domain-containing protein [Paenibacillus vini]MDN4069321.1 stalk domain-containing protein [Paenibacillus vini]
MKKLLYLAIGVVIGASVGYGPTTYAAVKQFILTEFNRPVVVNGAVYKDAQNPILNYNGKTYIPLAKIGDLTGVNYKWNAEKKQVEIGSSSGGSQSGDSLTYIIDDGRLTTLEYSLAEEAAIKEFTENNKVEIIESSGLVDEDGKRVLYFKNKYGTDEKMISEDDVDYVLAKIKKEPLPPSINDGWINGEMLYLNIQDYNYITDVPKEKLKSVKTKEFNNKTYYYIEDLINNGILKIK